MRYPLIILCLLFTVLLSAQCETDAEVKDLNCNFLTGETVVSFSFSAPGPGSSWYSPTLDMSGVYDTSLVFTSPLIDLTLTGGIQFVDQDFPDCGFFLPVDSILCIPAECDDYEALLTLERVRGCGADQVHRYLVQASEDADFPVWAEVYNASYERVAARRLFQQNWILTFNMPSGETWQVRITDDSDCIVYGEVSTESVTCGNINGRSWVDDNEDGIQDAAEVNTLGGGIVSMYEISAGGNLSYRAETTIDTNGYFSIDDVPCETCYLGVINNSSNHILTLENQGEDENLNSDFSPLFNKTPLFTLLGGGTITRDIGWKQCPLISATISEVDQEGPCVAPYQLLTISSDAYPLNVEILRDSVEVIREFSIDADGEYSIEQLAPGNYFASFPNDNGCMYTVSFTQSENFGLDVDILRVGEFCSPDGVALSVDMDSLGLGEFTYNWSSGASSPSIVVTDNEQAYRVTVTRADGCTGNASLYLDLVATVPIDVPEFINLECRDSLVEVAIANPVEGMIYSWSGNPVGGPDTGTVTTLINAGRVTVRGNNNKGCTGLERFWVIDRRLQPDTMFIRPTNPAAVCAAESCLFIYGIEHLDDDNLDIIWQVPPSYTELVDSIGHVVRQICGAPEGLYTATVMSACDTIVLSYNNNLPSCSEISGDLLLDDNGDCGPDPDDLAAPGFVVTLTNDATGVIYYAWTATDGSWTIDLPNGVYTIEPIVEEGLPLATCPVTTVSLNGIPVTGVNLYLPVLENCPVLTSEITIPYLRRCFGSTAFVHYENKGAAVAEDGQLVVELDPFFTDVEASLNPVSVIGNVYTFDLGDLPPFGEGTIRFQFTVSCNAQLGQTHCVASSLTPNTSCGADAEWNGALVNITDAVCEGDSVRFTVSNVGNSAMNVPLTYSVLLDSVLTSTEPFVYGILEAGEDFFITLAAEGVTVTLITNQEPDAPGSENPTVVAEGCGTSQTFTTGFANLLPLATGDPTAGLVCRRNVGAYDPNDKRGYPLGWDGGNIKAGTRLDYEIRFQNTGTDTAFTVVISDTIAPELDLATFKPEVGSHPYIVTIDTHRVVTWTFNNIMLPDSSTNLALSQGSVVFSIDHASALQPGDEILNEAAIYFDFNEPIITNVSRHVIATEGLPTSVRRTLARSVPLRVFPNPADDRIRLQVDEKEVENTDLVTITDLLGRPLILLSVGQSGGGVDVRALPPGYYVLVLTDASGRAKGRAAFMVTSR